MPVSRLDSPAAEGIASADMSVLLLLFLQAAPLSSEALEKHVRVLAADDMKGRAAGSGEGMRAAAYVAERFKEAGLHPAGREGWFHDFEVRDVRGRNVIGSLPGRRKDGWVILAAHHDARGVIDGKIQNGADDNASGVAIVIEAARALAGKPQEQPVLFISFDAEERGLLGSRELLKSGLLDPSTVSSVVVLDLVGGRLFPWEDRRLYALGSESSPVLDAVLGGLEQGSDLELRRLSVGILEPFAGMARSDYGPFRDRKVPFVFFSTGSPWYYHTEHDDPDVIDFRKLALVGAHVGRVLTGLASAPERPRWEPFDASARTRSSVAETLREILDHRETLGLPVELTRELEGLRVQTAEAGDVAALQRALMKILTVVKTRKQP